MAIKLSGLVSGMDTEAMIEELVSAYSTRKDKVFKEQKTLSYKQEAWSELNGKIYGFYSKSLSNMQLTSNYSLKKASCSNSVAASITADANAVNGTQELKIKQLAKTAYLTGAKVAGDAKQNTSLKSLGIEKNTTISVNVGGETKEVQLKSGMTIKQLDAELSDLGLNVNFDEHNSRFFISSKESGKDGEFSITATDEEGIKALNALGLSTATDATIKAYEKYIKENEGNMDVDEDKILFAKDMVEYAKIYNKKENVRTEDEKERLTELQTTYGNVFSAGATKIDGQDAIIELNGAEFTSTTNSFQINGLTITAQATTKDDEIITITTDTDVDAVYDKIKGFFKEYNELMTEMYTKYNAESAGDYEPLTEEEEEELSETQIEKWEKILKTAALRRDSTLSSIMSSMRTAMSTGVEIGGKNYTFATFGINTLGYFNADENERACYHIDGDEDDENTSSNTDKLREAIINDPEATIEFFATKFKELYKTLDAKLATSNDTKSIFKVYNDKYMQKQYDSYTEKLEDWDDKIEKYRERYEKQFSNMEVAMAKLQSQTSAVSSLMGMSTY